MIERVQRMLELCADPRMTHMPPTELYNEGWLLRLALDWHEAHPDKGDELSVRPGTRWYSEALLPTQFRARRRPADDPTWQRDGLAEKHTHADGAVGHFTIGGTGDGDLVLDTDATHFVVLEAKLKSGLSKGTRNVLGYDQAARNVACMAHVLSVSGRHPSDMTTLGFYVVAPASQIATGMFSKQLTVTGISQRVQDRVVAYKGPDRERHDEWFDEWFVPMLSRIRISTVSWEAVRDLMAGAEPAAGESFARFYDDCLTFNRLMSAAD